MDELTRHEPMRREHRRRAGLSMIEVMMALSILAGGLLVMLSMQIQAMNGGRHGRNATEAAQIAQAQMARLHHQDFTTLAATGGWTVVVPVTGAVTGGGGAAASTGQQYQLDWMVSQNPDPNPAIIADTWQIDVRVRWADPNARPGVPLRSYVISSIRYDD